MKTLPLLVCICALSACFSLSEGHRRPVESQYPRTGYKLPLPNRPPLSWKPVQNYFPFYPVRIPKPPVFPLPPKCPTSTSEATTTAPSTSSKSPKTSTNTSAPQPSTAPTQTTAAPTTSTPQTSTAPPVTTPSPSPTTSAPSTSETTAAPTTQNTTTTGTPTTAVEPPIPNETVQFLLYLQEIIDFFFDTLLSN
ncbi:mucin-7 [Tamandua tetradactyla]|uniref:mucin-7 n=1 Tax=Tamandua tetradactyla TaxID=48850 RepID=UPI004053F184